MSEPCHKASVILNRFTDTLPLIDVHEQLRHGMEITPAPFIVRIGIEPLFKVRQPVFEPTGDAHEGGVKGRHFACRSRSRRRRSTSARRKIRVPPLVRITGSLPSFANCLTRSSERPRIRAHSKVNTKSGF